MRTTLRPYRIALVLLLLPCSAALAAQVRPGGRGVGPGAGVPPMPPLEKLLEDLKGGNAIARRQAARSIGLLKDKGKDAIPQLCTALLEDPDPGVRVQAALALGSVVAGSNPVATGRGSPEATAALVELLRDKDEPTAVRRACCQSLGKLSMTAQGAAPDLGKVLRDPEIGEYAAKALGALGQAGQTELLACLQLPPPVLYHVLDGLMNPYGKVPDEVFATLRQLSLRDDPILRRKAVGALVRLQAPASYFSVPPLRLLLQDRDLMVRIHALDGLGRLGHAAAPAVNDLVRALGEEQVTVRLKAIGCLRKIGPAARPAVPFLLDALRSPSPDMRAAAAGALGWVGADPKEVVGPLTRVLSDLGRGSGVSHPASEAVSSLGALGPDAGPAVSALLKLLKDGPQDMQERALVALARIGKPALEGLFEMMKSPQADVRNRATRTLYRMGWTGPEVLPPLRAALKDPDTGTRQTAAWALARMRNEGRPASADLMEALADREALVADAAADALEQTGVAPEGLARLLELSRDMDPLVRRRAARALATVGDEGTPRLQELQRDDDLLVAAQAAWSVKYAVARAAKEPLWQDLRSSDRAVRLKAALELVRRDWRATETLPELAAAIRNGTPEEQLQAATAVACLGRPAATHEVISALYFRMSQADPKMRRLSTVVLRRVLDPREAMYLD